ncbi:hypothetical protein SAMN05428988_0104 [Chitinophaga sp. YR573]|nr:hypothetical protein SAMN05428988_0104 [Chitinophaga sp. YR573]
MFVVSHPMQVLPNTINLFSNLYAHYVVTLRNNAILLQQTPRHEKEKQEKAAS